jgi:hypothetical protein
VEEFLVVLIQFVIEVLIDFLIYLPFGWPAGRAAPEDDRSGCGLLGLYLVLGGVVGGVSLLVAPRLLLHAPELRVANLFVAPVAAGGCGWALASWRRSRGAVVNPTTHLWTGSLFVLAFGAVRLAYGGR